MSSRDQRGTQHTVKKRKLEISKGAVKILQCNVTTCSEHARHYILTSDFDATLISETHLRKDGLLSAVTEAKKSGWAGTGSAATNTVNNGTSAGVLTLVRKRWFSKPLSICSDDAGILCPNPQLAGRVIRVMGKEILLLTAYLEHSVGFRSDINANLMHDVCFLTRDEKFPFIMGADFNFPPSLSQDLSLHGGGTWTKQLGASVVIPEGSSHTCRTGRGQKPDITDYFMVSACIRPLIQKCEVIKSVLWRPHYGVKLVLNIDFESVLSRQLMEKISRRNHHKVGATHEGPDTDLMEEADPTFQGRKPRCNYGKEIAEAACSQYANAVGTLEESDVFGHALETWSDATAQYWASSGREGQPTLSGKFAKFRDFHATGMRHP